MAAGTTSASAPRSSSDQWFCAEMNGVRPALAAVCAASASCQPDRLECPMYRTLPAVTSSSSAAMVSSTGVSGSGLCSW